MITMSAWVIALGLSAGYLINKNLNMTEKLEEKVKVYQEGVKPAKPGPTSETIRNVQRTVPTADKYEEINTQDLNPARVAELTSKREKAHQEVVAYEQGPPPIQGVWLNLGDRGSA